MFHFRSKFDIKLLFTKMPLIETLNPSVENRYWNQTHTGNLTKSSFYKLLRISMFKLFFIFNGKLYEQLDSPYGPSLANVFMSFWKHLNWKLSNSFQACIVHRGVVDNTFLLFRSNFLNSKKFTLEIEENVHCLYWLWKSVMKTINLWNQLIISLHFHIFTSQDF